MSFYKMQSGQQEFYFQLANLELAKEDYVFWKEGEVPPFPMREAINGITAREAYWDKTGTKQVVGYRPDRSFIRDIIVNQGGINSQYLFAFKKRDIQQLDTEISNIVNLQRKNPLHFNFKFRKTGHGMETIRVVIAMQEVGIPQNVQQSSVPYQNASQQQNLPMRETQKQEISAEVGKTTPEQKSPEIAQKSRVEFELPKSIQNMQQAVALTEKEQVVYGLACDYTGTLSKSDFVDGFVHTYKKMFSEELNGQRAIEIYDVLYSK